MSKPTESAPPSTVRRDYLRSIELAVQQQWADHHVFESDASDTNKDKYFANFPYPYMNGVLHLGHAYTFSKVDYQCNYQRLKGKNVLWPFGFHCTGMPIQASAQKLQRELSEANTNDNDIDDLTDDTNNIDMNDTNTTAPIHHKTELSATTVENTEHTAPIHTDNATTQPKQRKGRSKVAAKATGTTQYDNMIKMGVPATEIHKFTDPIHWLHYFPPIGKQHLQLYGACIDWRRSMITTDVNPYYDSFIQWQFRRLLSLNKVWFGNRPCIFSPRDNQACADHDRAEGEGVQITDYTLIKMHLQQPYCTTLQSILQSHAPYQQCNVYLPAATLRPETMYGQTNAWLLPDGEYGIYVMQDNRKSNTQHNTTSTTKKPYEIFICSAKSALNMSYQDLTETRGKPLQLGTIKGMNLMGSAVVSPYASFKVVYVLPLLTISMTKGTGVVTSVPSDAPDDYAALQDLRTKQPLRAKYNIKDEHVLPYEAVPIINTPGLGDIPAVTLCIEAKVASQNDKAKLEVIKDKCYKDGFAKGTLLVGKHKGEKVSIAKPIIKDEMISEGLAYPYSEPESRVVSRSGNECVVALTDQWYEGYGEPEWRDKTLKYVQNTLHTYNDTAKHDFEIVLGWMHEWACSRSFGLGSKLPCAPEFVIESLSDSTIYMAYYTVAHFLQGNIEGSVPGTLGIQASELNDDVWNYVLNITHTVPKSSISVDKLNKLRNEFNYWYGFDLRVSGKDLINNHLTMSLYNHTAIWPDQPDKWPKSMFCNGHVLVDSAKMSKSVGNFITLEQAINEFGVDATRLACADAGDTLEDANFERKAANAAILRLTKEEVFIQDSMKDVSQFRTDTLTFFDQVFLNEINGAIIDTDIGYKNMQYRQALKAGVFELQDARDRYRVAIHPSPMHIQCIQRYIEVSTLLISPICPHYAQHIWHTCGYDTKYKIPFIAKAHWPTAEPVDTLLQRQIQYLRTTQLYCRDMLSTTIDMLKKRAAKQKQAADSVVEPNSLILFVSPTYPQQQSEIIQKLLPLYQALPNHTDHTTALESLDKKQVITELKQLYTDKKQLQDALKFSGQIQEEYKLVGMNALELQLPFHEIELLHEYIQYVVRDLPLKKIDVMNVLDVDRVKEIAMATQTASKALPGKPSPFYYVNE